MTRDRGFAGSSAYREHARRRRERDVGVDDAPASIRELLRDASGRSRDIAARRKGAAGETVVGRALDGLADAGVRVLHDRAVPGTTANIDHLAISPTGVYVVDAKNYAARPRVETIGAGATEARRLYLGRDDGTGLVQGVRWQLRVVEAILADAAVPVRGILCFVGAEWELVNGFVVDGVGVTSPDRLAELLRIPGPLPADRIDAIHRRMSESLDAVAG